MKLGGRKGKKRFKMTGAVWQLVGLAVLAALTLGVVAYALVPSSTAPVAGPTVQPTATQPAKPRPVVAFVGDSYTAGSGVSSPSLRWSTRLSLTAGWREENLGRGGTGYLITSTTATGEVRPNYATMIGEAVKVKPDVVVVSGGGNDMPLPLRDFRAAVEDFYPALRAALPDATIIAINPLWRAEEPPANLAALHETVQAAVTGVGGTFIDIGQPLQGHPELIIEDKVHPNDAGAKVIAEATYAALTKTPATRALLPG